MQTAKKLSGLSAVERPVLWTAPPTDAAPLKIGASRHGCEWEDDFGHFCLLSAVYPDTLSAAPEVQMQNLFGKFETLLARSGFAFEDVIRTWFFLDEILSVYDIFNRVRTAFFRDRGLLGRSPASTAVGAANPRGCAIEGHLLAFHPADQTTRVALAASPAQSSAFDYGSAFSRGLSIYGSSRSRLYVSGTASIDGNGNTLHGGSSAAQVRETFRIVEAMLTYHGYRFDDVVVANGYIPVGQSNVEVLRCWDEHLKLPFSSMQADVCRADLSFELELITEKTLC
ncbi:MAG TPA: Rid family hydrolase [Polyangiaceae bacterium]|nr:Rid family hydrolase [Polyangiaceae bacterium]